VVFLTSIPRRRIERLQARFFTGYGYRKECAVVLERIIATTSPDCVIALTPSGLRDAFLRAVRNVTEAELAAGMWAAPGGAAAGRRQNQRARRSWAGSPHQRRARPCRASI
jgi:hypothetical protein